MRFHKVLDKLNFLTGLPRSGNTLIASILNQNPAIYAGPHSPLVELLWRAQTLLTGEELKMFPHTAPLIHTLKSIPKAYYSNCSADLILDRGTWGCPENLTMITEYITPTPKFLVLVRPIEEVIVSFLRLAQRNPDSPLASISSVTEQFKHIINNQTMFRKGLLAVLFLHANRDRYQSLFIDYNNFVSDPVQELEKIYTFFELPLFTHSLTNIQQLTIDSITYDDSGFEFTDLHKLREHSVSKTECVVEDYLPSEIIQECREFNVWLKE